MIREGFLLVDILLLKEVLEKYDSYNQVAWIQENILCNLVIGLSNAKCNVAL